MTEAEEHLHLVLLDMRRLLRLPRLEYVSIQNQADYLIEVPVEVAGIPKVVGLASMPQGIAAVVHMPFNLSGH